MTHARSLAALGLLSLVSALAFTVAAAQTADEPVRVDVRADASGGSTRLLLQHGQTVVAAVQRAGQEIEIHYDRPVRLNAPDVEGEGLVRRIRLKGDRTIAIAVGPGFERHEHFELRNPFRLILDLHGAGAGTVDEGRTPSSREPRPVVVIDAGHGGSEQGAVGPGGLEEKEVALDVARRLRHALRQKAPRLSVVLTRDEDRLVPLDERTAVANHNQADLFVSIHLNASPSAQAAGAETYFLSSDATDDEARRLAGLENQGARVDEAALSRAGEASESLDLVLWDLAQNQYLAESSALAERIQRELNRLTGTRDRGVRQAPFRVLQGATMPAILVEVGFISNPAEEERFRGSDYRNRVADAIAAAVLDYLRTIHPTLAAEPSSPARASTAGRSQP